MLLGTWFLDGNGAIQTKFQSPERIHAFGNHAATNLPPNHCIVSIPREDSCFWEPNATPSSYADERFQSPERIHAFGNLPVAAMSKEHYKFQSPERIHAFGNLRDTVRSMRLGCVSIPREDSCFWEQRMPSPLLLLKRFNPQRGFMLLGTSCFIIKS